jgi:hypothetical protein
MPTNETVKARLINILTKAPEQQMTHRALVKACGGSYRHQAQDMISLLLSEGVFFPYGIGVRGSPRVIGLNKMNPDRCPLCHRPY